MLSSMDGPSAPNPARRKRLPPGPRQQGHARVNGRSGQTSRTISQPTEPAGNASNVRSPERRSFDALMESRLAESQPMWQAYLGPLLSKSDVQRLLGVESAQEID